MAPKIANVMMATRLALEMTENSHAYDQCASKKDEITCKFGLEDPKSNGYSSPRVFSDQLANMECSL